MKPIKLSSWKINLPVFPPAEVMDNSTLSEYARCPRRGLYRYGMRRGFTGTNFPIQFGLGYHKYRELIEEMMVEQDCGLTDEIHDKALEAACKGFIQPPPEHRHAHNDVARLILSCMAARDKVTREREQGKIVVTKTEDSFDLELPFVLCSDCGSSYLDKEAGDDCTKCTTKLVRARHGGRVDQFIRFVSLQDGEFVRDFKTTGLMGKTYDLRFEPNGQMQGYHWSKEELSGKKCSGVLIETLYNTKTKGPEIHQTYKSFSPGQQEQWLASYMMERQIIQLMWSRIEELGYLAFPQRTQACNDFGGCGYREACLSSGGFEIEQWLSNYTNEDEWDFTNPDGEAE